MKLWNEGEIGTLGRSWTDKWKKLDVFNSKTLFQIELS